MIQRIAALVAWVGLVSIVYATLCPIESRPEVASAHLEHFVAFTLLGLAFATAYPRHLRLVVLIVVGGALTLEIAQLLTPDRHAQVIDATIKAAGGFLGVAMIRILYGAVSRAELLPFTAEGERATARRAGSRMPPK